MRTSKRFQILHIVVVDRLSLSEHLKE